MGEQRSSSGGYGFWMVVLGGVFLLLMWFILQWLPKPAAPSSVQAAGTFPSQPSPVASSTPASPGLPATATVPSPPVVLPPAPLLQKSSPPDAITQSASSPTVLPRANPAAPVLSASGKDSGAASAQSSQTVSGTTAPAATGSAPAPALKASAAPPITVNPPVAVTDSSPTPSAPQGAQSDLVGKIKVSQALKGDELVLQITHSIPSRKTQRSAALKDAREIRSVRVTSVSGRVLYSGRSTQPKLPRHNLSEGERLNVRLCMSPDAESGEVCASAVVVTHLGSNVPQSESRMVGAACLDSVARRVAIHGGAEIRGVADRMAVLSDKRYKLDDFEVLWRDKDNHFRAFRVSGRIEFGSEGENPVFVVRETVFPSALDAQESVRLQSWPAGKSMSLGGHLPCP